MAAMRFRKYQQQTVKIERSESTRDQTIVLFEHEIKRCSTVYFRKIALIADISMLTKKIVIQFYSAVLKALLLKCA